MNLELKHNSASILLSNLGSHWYSFFDNVDQAEKVFEVLVRLFNQVGITTQEALYTLSLHKAPVLNQVDYKKVTAKRSEVVAWSNRYYTYSDGLNFGDIVFNQEKVADLSFVLDIENIIDPSFLVDKPLNNTKTLVKGFDFEYSDGKLVFYEDPFLVFPVKFDETGEKYCEFYIKTSYEDRRNIQKSFGDLVGLSPDASSEYYKELMLAVWESLVNSTTQSTIRRCIAALIGTPLVRASEELVEDVIDNENSKIVVTDKFTYYLHPKSNITVEIGQKLTEGDTLCDSLLFFDNFSDISPDFPGVVVEKAIGAPEGGLFFVNRNVPVTKTTKNGKIRCQFQVSNNKKLNSSFWSAVHAKEDETGQYISPVFRRDGRFDLNAAFEQDLVNEINPTKFFIDFMLDAGFLAAVINQKTIQGPVSQFNLKFLRTILPPNVFLAFVINLDTVVECNQEITNQVVGFQAPEDPYEAVEFNIINTVSLFYVE